MDTEIRKARLKDVPEIVKLWEEFGEEHIEITTKNNAKSEYQEKKTNAKDIWEKWIRKSIRSKNSLVAVAEFERKLIGYVLSNIKKTPPVYKIDTFGYISDLFVKKQYRGSGISSKFKDESFKWFKEKGLKHSMIGVYSDNPHAHFIYKKWGFVDSEISMKKKL
ncbi:MAG: GNAT family N-acetyltransferase [Nanoarchaeota archaeon]|nr:GNAT family N-acetyltransferase [Nanoarchaeota archaeon]MBU1135125.1 GNAT family N-acetyltransferase [Nanoarchaeota archaeon]MBU2520135.1 GNAT family N-acetyltransferase [Nanoarchaeota archaeon]